MHDIHAGMLETSGNTTSFIHFLYKLFSSRKLLEFKC